MYWIDVYNPDGSRRAVLSTEDPIDAVAWTRRGDGDCGEGLIRGRGLDLRPRDIVAIRTADTAHYAGWVVESHDPRATGLVETRLIGGSQRLREVLNPLPWMVGADLRAMAAAALAVPLPPRMVGVANNVVGFVGGAREPRLETLADTLSALAALAPGYTVPAGATYQYAGVTYTAGQEVPAVTWGTVPVGIASNSLEVRTFFGRPQGILNLTESSPSVPLILEWAPAVSEQVVDRVRVVLFDRATQGATWQATHFDTAWPTNPGIRGPIPDDESAPVPVSHEYVLPGSQLVAWGRVDQVPGEGLRPGAWTGGLASINAADAGRALDGDLATFAANAAAGPFRLSRPAGLAVRGVRIRYSSFVPVTLFLGLQYRETALSTLTWYASAALELPSTEGDQADASLVCPPSLHTQSPSTVSVIVRAGTEVADAVRVYDLVPLEPDAAVLDRLAQSAIKLPPPASAVLTLPGRLRTPLPKVSVALAAGGTLTASAETWEYSITRESGLQTRVRLGQALPSDQARAQALLDMRLAGTLRASLRGRT